MKATVQEKFATALAALVEQVKADRSVLAAILCGSLSHDTVWDKSDIDLVLITVDDKRVDKSDYALNSDDVNIHAFLMPRTAFRKIVEGSAHNSFMHSLLAKGRLIYTHDPTIGRLCEGLVDIGARDTELQLLRCATNVLPLMYKARKWFITRRDLEYTTLWILYSATLLARIEVIGRRMLADREVIVQALKLNPAFFKTVYTDLLNTPKTERAVAAALEAVEGYVAARAASLFAPIIEHLQDVGEARSCTEIEMHFTRQFDVGGVTTACEYLADQGLIGKASTAVRLTKASTVAVQELAFFALDTRDI